MSNINVIIIKLIKNKFMIIVLNKKINTIKKWNKCQNNTKSYNRIE